jgi:glucosamine 6-phosphate synthetase-like amidotransferase/phosphosugar isomerase protein
MCGIVSYFGPNDGVQCVLNALQLLTYRAPDSSGLAVMTADGELAVRRTVGTALELERVLAANPLPPLRESEMQVVVGHGRWAMVGAVTEINTHPISDRSGTRVICENGSHNASVMLGGFEDQERWWRARGVPQPEPVHRTQNTSEVLVCEWERMVMLLQERSLPEELSPLLTKLIAEGVDDVEEQALRLAVWRLRHGYATACTFYSCHRPDTLYVTSHNKPIALITHTNSLGEMEMMVASDVNAALMLWSPQVLQTAVRQIERIKANNGDSAAIKKILEGFNVNVIFLDDNLNHGQELFARIHPIRKMGQLIPKIEISRFDGTPVSAVTETIQLNPVLIGKKGFATYTENHINEIPDVLDNLVAAYVQNGQIHLQSTWREAQLFAPGLNLEKLISRFGDRLEGLQRLLLVGEGSSWRNSQAAAPLFRKLLPSVLTTTYRPIQVLNLGEAIDPDTDLAIEISWSGTTDSLLKVDKWLSEMEVVRLAITGRAQSDLGRRTAQSGGTIDVQTGVEVSVATVKGYEAILFTLDLLALQLASVSGLEMDSSSLIQLIHELTLLIPRHVRSVVSDQNRKTRLRELMQSFRYFNKIAIIGNSPIDIEAELKIEEVAQVLARTFDFHDADLRAIIEQSALVKHDRWRTFFIINAMNSEAQLEAQFILNYLHELDVRCVIHTTPHERLAEWQALPNAYTFVSPPVSASLQPLVDAPFFFDLAVAFAYARGLSAAEIDRPRNLAKSVTTTGAEKRTEIEARHEFHNVDLAAFSDSQIAQIAWSEYSHGPAKASLRATYSLRSALVVLQQKPPPQLKVENKKHLVVVTDTRATENGARMAEAAWQELLGVDLTTFRRFINEVPVVRQDTILLQLIRAGSVLAVRDERTITLPSDLSPLQMELLTATYLMGLAIRLARQRGEDISLWESGLAQLPLLMAQLMDHAELKRQIHQILAPYVSAGYDKLQIIGGGQDFTGAASIARSLRLRGFMAEGLYTDSAWHGPLATVGGPDPEHDVLILILATDPLFQAAALVDTQVYRARHAKVVLVVPQGNEELPAVRGVDASSVLPIMAVPRPFLPLIHAVIGDALAQQMELLWLERRSE